MDIYDDIVCWEVSDEFTASDHRYVNFSLCNRKPKARVLRNPRNTNWDRFRAKVRTKTTPIENDILDIMELDREADKLSVTLSEAYKRSCPPTVSRNSAKCSWWSKKLRLNRIQLRALLKAEKLNDTPENREKRKVFQQKYKKEIRSAKRTHWRNFCTEIAGLTAAAKMHKMMSKDPKNGPGFLKDSEGNFTKTDGKTLRILMGTHFPGCVPAPITSDRLWSFFHLQIF